MLNIKKLRYKQVVVEASCSRKRLVDNGKQNIYRLNIMEFSRTVDNVRKYLYNIRRYLNYFRKKRCIMEEKDMSLKGQLIRFNILWHRYVHYHRGMHRSHGDIHRGQGRVLSILKMKPEMSQKELSYLLDVRSQSLGELLAKLEKKEFITRIPSDSDRRSMIVKLTKKGEAVANDPQESDMNKILDCLNEAEQNQFSEYLERLANELKKSFKEDDLNDECFKDFRRERADFMLRAHGHMHGMGHCGCGKHADE